MTIKQRLLENITGAKALGVILWFAVVQIPVEIAHFLGAEGVTDDFAKLVLYISASILGVFMGTRMFTDLGSMKANGNGS